MEMLLEINCKLQPQISDVFCLQSYLDYVETSSLVMGIKYLWRIFDTLKWWVSILKSPGILNPPLIMMIPQKQ